MLWLDWSLCFQHSLMVINVIHDNWGRHYPHSGMDQRGEVITHIRYFPWEYTRTHIHDFMPQCLLAMKNSIHWANIARLWYLLWPWHFMKESGNPIRNPTYHQPRRNSTTFRRTSQRRREKSRDGGTKRACVLEGTIHTWRPKWVSEEGNLKSTLTKAYISTLKLRELDTDKGKGSKKQKIREFCGCRMWMVPYLVNHSLTHLSGLSGPERSWRAAPRRRRRWARAPPAPPSAASRPSGSTRSARSRCPQTDRQSSPICSPLPIHFTEMD